jgi:hypothetical protein
MESCGLGTLTQQSRSTRKGYDWCNPNELINIEQKPTVSQQPLKRTHEWCKESSIMCLYECKSLFQYWKLVDGQIERWIHGIGHILKRGGGWEGQSNQRMNGRCG